MYPVKPFENLVITPRTRYHKGESLLFLPTHAASSFTALSNEQNPNNMKRPRFLIVLMALFAAMSVMLSACTKDEIPPKTPQLNVGGGLYACSDSGTVVPILCGASVLGGYYIELDNGLLLQPCEVLTNLNVPVIDAGTRVKVAYQLLQGPTACDSMIICAAIDPRAHLAKKVKLMCIERIYSLDDCNETGIVRYNPTCQLRYIQMPDSTYLEPENQSALLGYNDGDAIEFSKDYVCTLVATCTSYPGVQVKCIRRKVVLD